jgi:hypothetical protein
MKRTTILAGLLTLVLLSGDTLMAAVRATLLLKSGSRVSGDLVDMSGSGITIRVSGRERLIPTRDVAVIDLQGNASNLPDGEVSRASGGRGVFVMRGGQIADGRLTDVGGTEPKRLSFDTPSGARDHTSDEVARIYLAAVPGRTVESETPPTTPGSIAVSADRAWTPTGIWVRRGDRVSFSATGEIRLSDDPADLAAPAGSKMGRYDRGAPIPTSLAGALIGRVGSNRPFGIGNQTGQLTMPEDGELYLGVNDGSPGDNRGRFDVVVRGGQPPRTRRERY